MMKSILIAGSKAPDFNLQSKPNKWVQLSNFRDRPLVLAFYPADWSPVCGDQLGLYSEAITRLHPFNAALVAISVDSVWCHQAYAEARHLTFPLLADFEPKGAIAQAYGVYRANEGVTERALFVVDGGGVIQWSHLSPIEVNPGLDGVLAALHTLQGDHGTRPALDFGVAGHEPYRGAIDASVTLVEFGDYECPHCAIAHEEVAELLQKYASEVRYVFRNFPLTRIHPNALLAAGAAETAKEFGKFWEMHDRIFAHQKELCVDDLVRHAVAIGLEEDAFAKSLQSGVWRARVQGDFDQGIVYGVNGTPCFFINGQRHNGDHSVAVLSDAIENALRLQSSKAKVELRR